MADDVKHRYPTTFSLYSYPVRDDHRRSEQVLILRYRLPSGQLNMCPVSARTEERGSEADRAFGVTVPNWVHLNH